MRGRVAVIGASNDRRKFGNKALRAYAQQGYEVVPVNPHESTVEGRRAVARVTDVADPIDIVTVYVPAEIGITLLDDIAAVRPREVWINPGAESDALLAKARALGLDPIVACSIVGIGASPARF